MTNATHVLVVCPLCGSRGYVAIGLDPTELLAIHTAGVHADKVPNAQRDRLDALYGADGSRRN